MLDILALADKYHIEEFIGHVERGVFTNYDGIGYFGIEQAESEEQAWCDVNFLEQMSAKYTHVYWYNR